MESRLPFHILGGEIKGLTSRKHERLSRFVCSGSETGVSSLLGVQYEMPSLLVPQGDLRLPP